MSSEDGSEGDLEYAHGADAVLGHQTDEGGDLDVAPLDDAQLHSERLYESQAEANPSTFMKRLRASLLSTYEDETRTEPRTMAASADTYAAVGAAERRLRGRTNPRMPTDGEKDAIFEATHGVSWAAFCAVLKTTADRASELTADFVAADAAPANALAAAPSEAATSFELLHTLAADLRTLRHLEGIQPPTTCKICQHEVCQVVLQPCGHTVCSACSRRLGSTCPFCCKFFYQTQRLYFA
jgi:hypothetical protein